MAEKGHPAQLCGKPPKSGAKNEVLRIINLKPDAIPVSTRRAPIGTPARKEKDQQELARPAYEQMKRKMRRGRY